MGAVIGEVGLGGEVRRVRALERRLQEAANLQIALVMAPAGGGDNGAVKVKVVRRLDEAVKVLA